jgi:polar amino acid transport system substrate-binding protein
MLSGLAFAESLPAKITLATTEWCPYTCEHSSKGPGFVAEYISEILKKHKIELVVRSLPWSRAIEMAKAGTVDGILTGAASEMEGLKPTTTPTGTYNVCFYTSPKSKWTYKDASSLKDGRFGIISGYSYGEPMDAFIANKENSSRLIVKHAKDGLLTLLEMVKAQRFDATLDDRNVVEIAARERGIKMSELRSAGCLGDIPYFMAFSPQRGWADQVIKVLNDELGRSENKASYQKLLARYTK